MALSNGLEFLNPGEFFGDNRADEARDIARKWNQALPLLLTVRDRSIPNADVPFTFEGDLTVLGQMDSAQASFQTLSTEGLAVSGSASVDSDLAVSGQVSASEAIIQGDASVLGTLSAQSLETESELSVSRLSSPDESNQIDLAGTKFVNAFQTPTRAFELVNKQYVDQRMNGLEFFASCRLTDDKDPLSNRTVSEETDADGNYTGKLIGTSNLTLAGIDVNRGDRILVTSFRSNVAYRNGIYAVSDPGSNTTGWVLERAEDFILAETMNSSEFVYVREPDDGTKGGNAVYHFIREVPFTPDDVFSRAIYFSSFQANVSVFSGDEAALRSRLSSLESDLNTELNRLESAISQAQQTQLPEEAELPVGAIIFSLSEQTSQANGTFLKLDGSSYSQADFPELFAVIGNQYDTDSTPDGEFRLPDMRDRMLTAAGKTYSLGQTGGIDAYKLRPSQLPSYAPTVYAQGHRHNIEVWKEDNQNGTKASDALDSTAPMVSDTWQNIVTSNSLFRKTTVSSLSQSGNLVSSKLGGANPVNNLPPYFAGTPYVKAKPAIVFNRLPKITWFSFDESVVNTSKSADSRTVSLWLSLDTSEFSDDFLQQVKAEVINERTGTVLWSVSGLDGTYSNKTEVVIRELPVGDSRLSLRLSEPTVPNDIRSSSLSYRRFPPESPTASPQSAIDLNCTFEILSAFASPSEVSIGDTINYRTQAAGVYHIRTTIYRLPDSGGEAEVIPGTVTGDIEDVSCRQLLTAGSYVVPRTAKAGDFIAVEFKYWSPVSPSDDPSRVETVYIDVI